METHGYGLVDLDVDGAQVTFVATAITARGAPASTLARFEVDRGSPRIRQVEGTGFLARPDAAPGGPAVPGTGTAPAAASPAAAVPGSPAYTG